MHFDESCLYAVLTHPIDYVVEDNIYYSILRIPYFTVCYLIGIPVALCIDFITVMSDN